MSSSFLSTTLSAQEYSDSISINIFMLDECLITQKMSSYFNDLYAQHNSSPFYFQAYFPNFSSKSDNILKFKEKFKIEIPHKTDYFKTKSKELGATCLPEVVVKDEKKDTILYRGRINNLYDKIGSRRRVVTEHDLADVIQAIKEKEKITEKNSPAIGCFINFNEL